MLSRDALVGTWPRWLALGVARSSNRRNAPTVESGSDCHGAQALRRPGGLTDLVPPSLRSDVPFTTALAFSLQLVTRHEGSFDPGW